MIPMKKTSTVVKYYIYIIKTHAIIYKIVVSNQQD